MNGHADLWIDAYIDGELNPAQTRQVEAHLQGCPGCQALLEERRSLISLLQEVPPAGGLKPERQFVSEVNLRLAREQDEAPEAKRAFRLKVAWVAAPAALLLAWAFVQTVGLLSILVELIPGVGPVLSQQATAIQQSALAPGWFTRAAAGLGLSLPVVPPAVTELLQDVGRYFVFDWNILTGLAVLAVIGGLSAAWLAGWWAMQKNQ
jgi:anti-sigma factor RsiW